jgi:hypothetical protein
MRTRALGTLGLLSLLFLGVACGKGGGGGNTSQPATVTDPNTPMITNLRVSFGAGCTLPNQNRGTIETLSFDYVDSDGNLRGGVVDNRTTAALGGSATFSLPLPSPGVTMSGTSSGTITISACLFFGSNSSVSEEVRVTDTSGKGSNVLNLEVTRPAGVPLLPRDSDPSMRKSVDSPR